MLSNNGSCGCGSSCSVKPVGHGHDHGEGGSNAVRLVRLGVCFVLFSLAFFEVAPVGARVWLYLAAYLSVGIDVVWNAVVRLVRGEWFDENFLMALASIGAFAIGEYPEGVAVMLFYQVGEFFQDRAVLRSRQSIADMMSIRPDMARLSVDGEEREVSPDEVSTGDEVVVRAGERIPLDGVVVAGRGSVDTSALTGEAVPRSAVEGSPVISGTINLDGLLRIRVTREYGESTVVRILQMVENASERKAPTEHFITKFSKFYTPLVMLIALLVAVTPPLVIGGEWAEWIHRALVLLVISCPCALVLSVPLSFFAGIGSASRNGVLIKGGNFLEALTDIDTVVFDKTGTLTEGVFGVIEVHVADGFDKAALLYDAAHAESGSNHAIASSVKNAYGELLDLESVEGYREFSGKGVRAMVGGHEVLSGSKRLMEENGIVCQEPTEAGTKVYVARDGVFMGVLVIDDVVKPDSRQAIDDLRRMGVRRLVMLTGDLSRVGNRIKGLLGLDEVHAELLPDQKVDELEELTATKRTKGAVVFVGDGINDAPVLARADVGVAMGGLGADVAIEAADIVLMTDEPSRLVKAVAIARRTRRLATQNIVFAVGVKGVILMLGIMGIATMWEAVFADVGVSLLAVLNAMRGLNGGRGLYVFRQE